MCSPLQPSDGDEWALGLELERFVLISWRLRPSWGASCSRSATVSLSSRCFGRCWSTLTWIWAVGAELGHAAHPGPLSCCRKWRRMTRFLRYAGITLRRPCALLAALSVTTTSGNMRCLHRLYSRAVALAASGNHGGTGGGQRGSLSPRAEYGGHFLLDSG